MPKKIRRIVLLFLLVMLSLPVSAREPISFRTLTKKEGISQNSVIAIAQDAKGFMWFGTRDGLNRYDGNRFRIYRNQQHDEHSLPFNNVRALHYDESRDWLWVGTTKGLCRYRKDHDDFVSYDAASGLNDLFIHFINQDQSGEIWVGTDRGLYFYQSDTDTFVALKNLPDRVVRAIIEDADGRILVGTSTGLYRLVSKPKMKDALFEKVDPGGKGTYLFIQDLVLSPANELWIATRNAGLYRWDIATDQLQHFPASEKEGTLSNDNVRALAVTADGTLWAGTFVGLNRLPPGADRFDRFFEAPRAYDGLKSHSVHALFADRRGSLWVGTYYGGVSHHHPLMDRISYYSRREGQLNHEVVSAFAEDDIGNLWIGTEGGGLNFFNRSTESFTPYSTEAGLLGKNVKSLLLNGDGLWIGMYQHGMSRMDLATGAINNKLGFYPDSAVQQLINVYDIHLKNDTLWLALFGQGLAQVALATGQITLIQQEQDTATSLSSNECRSILEDSRGRMWVATAAGLNLLQEHPSGQPTFRHFLDGHIVYCVTQVSDGHLWVGTYGQGLFLLDLATYTVTKPTSDQVDFSGSTVYSIVEDGNGRIWINTSRGTTYWNPETSSFSTFEFPDGLENQEFRINAVHQTSAGELAFGGTEGFTLFDPNELQVNPFPPPLVFTDLKVSNKPVTIDPDGGMLKTIIDETRELVFSYNQANFSLSFAALDYLYPQNNRYEYKLEGVDGDWVASQGDTEVSYTLQAAGTYRFRVRAANSDGKWNLREREIMIRVKPPPWLSWYAYLTYLAIFGLLVYAVLRYTFLQHQLRLEQATKDQQEELHQAKLRFFTNITHELRTPLTLMIGPLESIRRSGEIVGTAASRLYTVEKNSRRLLQLVNQLLSFRKLAGERETLQLDGQDIVSFCQDIITSFKELARNRDISLRFNSNESHLPVSFDRDKLEKVLYNLLANAFKFTQVGGRIELHLRREGTKVYLRVTDNGEGIPLDLQERIFARFFERKSLTQRDGTGIGLAIVREYIEMHGGEITVNSRPGMGSSFICWIPVRPVQTSVKSAEFAENTPAIGTLAAATNSSFSDIKEDFLPSKKKEEAPPLILIVEDNIEVRDYIESVLVEDYLLETAANGKKGLQLARRLNPDLVISDVMMPEMDGIELCKILKAELQTSHLPVILLTAKSSELQRLEGLETGADDYISKPFSPRELQLRVRNLLHSVRQAKEKAARTLRLEPGEVKVTPADTKFLEQAINLVNLHMNEPNYRVDDFARDLAVSRALLFTKVKAITGYTPNGFIKLLKMKRAAQLIRTGELGVAQVASRVGYRDVKYFSKCFQQAYDLKPSEFAKNEKGESA